MSCFGKYLSKIENTFYSKEFRFILILFLISRLTLTGVGVFSRDYLKDRVRDWYEWNYSKQTWLDIWSVWDSGWYLDIAENGYSTTLQSNLPKKVVPGQTNIGFFPLYPVLIKTLNTIINDNYISALIVSNLSLLISAVFLFKLTEREYGKSTAYRAIVYLFLFPTTFVLSGIFSESLFLLLSIMSFYFANKQNWLASGVSGFFLSLTRPTGVLIAAPILFIYLQKKNFDFKNLKYSIFYLGLIPLGLILFMTFAFFLTGDLFAYFHSKTIYWGFNISNPLTNLLMILTYSPSSKIIGVFILSTISLLIATYDILPASKGGVSLRRMTYQSSIHPRPEGRGFLERCYKKINPIYSIYALLLIFLTLISGAGIAIGLPRMSAAFFPIYIALAKIKSSQLWEIPLVILLICLQMIFMPLWSNGLLII